MVSPFSTALAERPLCEKRQYNHRSRMSFRVSVPERFQLGILG